MTKKSIIAVKQGKVWLNKNLKKITKFCLLQNYFSEHGNVILWKIVSMIYNSKTSKKVTPYQSSKYMVHYIFYEFSP